MQLRDDVVEWFAREPMGPLFAVPRAADDPPEGLSDPLKEQLELVEDEVVATIRVDEEFLFHHGRTDRGGDEFQARVWALTRALCAEIPRRRLQEVSTWPPALASHPALSDLEFDDEGLLPLAAFEIRGGTVVRNGHTFVIMPQVESANAPYWITQALRAHGPFSTARVRLDPFLHGEESAFRPGEYRMWWWGARVSWDDLRARTGSEAGAWWPGPLSHGIQHTQYVWHSSGGKGQLEIEELQTRDRVGTRGTRYLHAIYDRNGGRVAHVDGAVRVLREPEWDQRESSHLKDAGKVGVRRKIFRIDEALDGEAFTALCSNYFVWNYDVARFCGASIPDGL